MESIEDQRDRSHSDTLTGLDMKFGVIELACFVVFNFPATGDGDLLQLLQREHAAVQSAKTSHSKALHSYLLNDAADRYAYSLNQGKEPRRDNDSEIQRANRYGASIHWCSYNGDWSAAPQGYEDYLSLWQDGPNAEEAWWRGRLGYRLNFCFDAVGSDEETRGFVTDYAEFLKHFPHGKHEREARQALRKFQSDLGQR
jgi:hypothetical protein